MTMIFDKRLHAEALKGQAQRLRAVGFHMTADYHETRAAKLEREAEAQVEFRKTIGIWKGEC